MEMHQCQLFCKYKVGRIYIDTMASSITPFFNQAMEGVGIAMASHKRVTLLPTIRTLSLG